MQTAQTSIRINNIKKYYKQVKAVDGISLEIQQGEYLAVLGPNGAGKTTLVEMLEGIQHPDSGEITIFGKNWQSHSNDLRNILGLSLQETRFYDKLTVFETIRLFASFFKISKQRCDDTINLIGLNEKRSAYVVNLSGGQRQRLALGVALLNEPQILILDEPTTGLDPVSRHELWEILDNLKQKRQTTLILTTHYMEEAEFLCEKIVILDQGKIIAHGTLDELLLFFNKAEIIQFSVEKPPTNGLSLQSILKDYLSMTFDERSGSYHLKVTESVSYLPYLFQTINEQNLKLSSIECRKMNLDDLFTALTGRKLHE